MTAVRQGADLVVTVEGALDTATWDEPVQVLAAELGHGGTDGARVERVVVDLGGVTFLDSSGLGTLVRMRSACHDAEVAMTIAHPRPMVRKLLVMTGLDTVFGVVPVSAGDRQDPGRPRDAEHLT
ncbi:STAS domain-containing protein [Jatrophihabitans sp. YIM 134969]